MQTPKALGRVVEVLNKVAEQEGVAASGYRTLVNTGPDANQIVMHTHFHLLAGKPLGPMLSAVHRLIFNRKRRRPESGPKGTTWA